MIHYDVGQFTVANSFAFFCQQFYNLSKQWYQLAAPPPNPLIFGSQVYMIPQAPPPDPIACGMMTLLDSGFDPLRGFWLRFQGNFDITCPLFNGFTAVKRNTPNYQIRQN